MSRVDLQNLWRSVRRPETTADGRVHPDWDRVQVTYEMLAVDRAQTVLRYWNWSLSSALTPDSAAGRSATVTIRLWTNIRRPNARR